MTGHDSHCEGELEQTTQEDAGRGLDAGGWGWAQERSEDGRMEGASAGKHNWNQGRLWDELETQESMRVTLAKTPTNGRNRA